MMSVIMELPITYMKKPIPTLLTILIGSALYSQQALADDSMSQCLLSVPHYNYPLIEGQTQYLPITINSDNLTANYPDNTLFSGNVNVQQGNRRLHSDTIQLHQKTVPEQTTTIRTIDAQGHVHYGDNQIVFKGSRAWSNLNTKDTNVWNSDYQLVGRQGHGKADQIKLRGENRYIILENGTFTTCLPGDNGWSIAGSKLIQDRQKEVAKIWNARFKIGAVPIFYSPYLQLSMNDQRRSGFLIPNAKFTNNNGFEFLMPYYWNIAPNIDATLTPHYIQKRGLQYQNEFRYLTRLGKGLIEFDYLSSDHKLAREHANKEDEKRWFFHWQHSGVYGKNWRFNTNFSKVSDSYYFNDLNSPYYTSTDGYLAEKFSIGYADENWNGTLSSKNFQVFSIRNVYRAQPQLDVNFYQDDVGPFDVHFYTQAVKFTNVDSLYPDAVRLHLEPTLGLPISNGWGSLYTEAKWLATHYQQNNIDHFNSTIDTNKTNQLAKSVNRVIPQFKINGKMVLDRDMYWAQGYTQTLEPQVQYLYIPFRDQSGIYPYDSTRLQLNYIGLFRDRIFSGLDRIADANQITTGMTSRIYDVDLIERFNVSVGQIYSLTLPRTSLSTIGNKEDSNSIVWAGELYWRLNNNWGTRGGIQYDTRLDHVSLENATLEYRQNADHIIQFNYRYNSPEYVASAIQIKNSSIIYKEGVSQIGVVASWSIADAWSVIGKYYYDIRAKQSAEQLIGFHYNSCCYAIRLGYERKINGWENNKSQYDNQVSLNIELRGLSKNDSLDSGQMLQQGILPYQRAFW